MTLRELTGGQIAESVSWFRRLDNNPVIVDPSTVIDINSYSRSVAANLPPGDTRPSNANLKVAESLGEPETQALMYAVVPRGATYFGLSADDVNMIKMQRTGPDLTANTSDDYTLQIDVVPCTMPHQIEVRFLPLPSGVLGACESAVDYAYPQPAATARVFKKLFRTPILTQPTSSFFLTTRILGTPNFRSLATDSKPAISHRGRRSFHRYGRPVPPLVEEVIPAEGLKQTVAGRRERKRTAASAPA